MSPGSVSVTPVPQVAQAVPVPLVVAEIVVVVVQAEIVVQPAVVGPPPSSRHLPPFLRPQR